MSSGVKLKNFDVIAFHFNYPNSKVGTLTPSLELGTSLRLLNQKYASVNKSRASLEEQLALGNITSIVLLFGQLNCHDWKGSNCRRHFVLRKQKEL